MKKHIKKTLKHLLNDIKPDIKPEDYKTIDKIYCEILSGKKEGSVECFYFEVTKKASFVRYKPDILYMRLRFKSTKGTRGAEKVAAMV